MKSRFFSLPLIFILILGSCAEKTIVCTLDNEYQNGELSSVYTYENGLLKQYDVYDSTGTIKTNYCVMHRNGNGDLLSVSEYRLGDTLDYEDHVYTNVNGLIDSIEVWFDTNGDNIGDSTGETYIYQYTGNEITTVNYHIPGDPANLVLTCVWVNGNLTETHNPSGSYSVYTYSASKSPYGNIEKEFLVIYKTPIFLQSTYMPSHRNRYNASSVLTASYDYTNAVDSEGKLTDFSIPSLNSSITYHYNCVEH